ncbi:MAG: trigger factor [Actinomycetota bacterium]
MNSTIATADDPRVHEDHDHDHDHEGHDHDHEGHDHGPVTPRELVRLTVTIGQDEFDRDIDAAFRKIGREARLPGFRNGKVPRKVLEARIGIQAAREEALRDAVPQYLAKAVREHDVDLIATPEVTVTAGAEEGEVTFEALCEIRPVITVPGYGGLRVEIPSPVASDSDIDEAVDAERRRQGTLVAVTRSAQHGDHVTLTLAATRDGEPVPGLNTEDWLYEIGKGWVAEDFDDRLVGTTAGTELTFSANPTGTEQPADFAVTVSQVQEMQLPEVTDEWVSENLGEFDTLEAWRASIAERIGNSRLSQARNQLVDRVTDSLAGLVDAPLPTSMVEGDLQARVQNMVRQFQAQGISVDQWLQLTGQTPDTFIGALRVQSEKAVKVDLAMRAVVVAEGITAADDDIEAEYARIAVQVGQKAKDVRIAYEKNDAVHDLADQIRKNKALDWLLEHVEIVDEAGTPIERELLLGRKGDA